MGRSFIEYKDRGFWTVDAYVRLYLRLLCLEIDALPERPGWLAEAREDWHLRATEDWFNGFIGLALDEYVGDDTVRAGELLELLDRARLHALSFGRYVPVNLLLLCGLAEDGGYSTEESLVHTETVAACGDAISRLLKGEITWDAATSPTLGNLGWG
ncbi:hypothetical protein [Microbispora sp. CA-102843]|uniref:hypothetical protein n=1 Tax=Microbispora sp. CA-102843 TaxID=3239952 RepID=UPI003D92090B